MGLIHDKLVSELGIEGVDTAPKLNAELNPIRLIFGQQKGERYYLSVIAYNTLKQTELMKEMSESLKKIAEKEDKPVAAPKKEVAKKEVKKEEKKETKKATKK